MFKNNSAQDYNEFKVEDIDSFTLSLMISALLQAISDEPSKLFGKFDILFRDEIQLFSIRLWCDQFCKNGIQKWGIKKFHDTTSICHSVFMCKCKKVYWFPLLASFYTNMLH